VNLFEVDKLKSRLADLEKETLKQEFWSSNNSKILQEIKILKDKINSYTKIDTSLKNLIEMNNLLTLEEEQELVKELLEDTKNVKKDIEELEIKTLLSGQYDVNNAIVSMHPGAGGTESQDWVEMLYRMYTRWAEKHNFVVKELDYLEGDEAGIKSVTFLVQGEYAYGYLKGEMGVHRLIRISPFDSGGRRHTSFASVEVLPEIEGDIEIEINPDDLRIDTYRASGAGGQHINKTSSAVRITHIPTNTVVACQSERSQIQNRETAMKMLKSKLFDLKEKERQKNIADLKGEQKDIAWGSQIRSYIFCPYTLVKDHRTNYEVGNVQAVMDGQIDDFIEDPEKYKARIPFYKSEISKCTYRQYTTGFFFGKPDENTQIYDSNTYIREYTYLGIVGDTNEQGLYHIEQRNKFSVGETIEVMKPDGQNIEVTVKRIVDENGKDMDSCPHPKQNLYIDLGIQLDKYDILRRQEEETEVNS